VIKPHFTHTADLYAPEILRILLNIGFGNLEI